MKRSVIYILFFTCLVLTLTCRKDPEDPKEQTIPEVITGEISILEAGVFKTYLVNAKIINEGSDPVTSLGVCWSINKNPTILNNKVSEDTGDGPPTVSKGNDGEFFCHINGDKLEPVTTYYVKAYATNAAGTAYGNELSFTTPCSLGNVSTNDSINVILKSPDNSANNQYTSLYLGWDYSPYVPISITYDVYFGPKPDPDSLVAQTGYRSYKVENLKLNTTYYWKVIGHTSCQEAISPVFGFTTVKEFFVPTVVTRPRVVSGIKYAILYGEIVSDGGTPLTEFGFYYGDAPEPEKTGTKISENYTWNDHSGSFSQTLWDNLKPDVKYFFKAFAINPLGLSYGEQIEFQLKKPTNPITDFEGNSYSTVTIGSQIWMAENLNSTKFNDGSPIPTAWPLNVYDDGQAAFCEPHITLFDVPVYGKLYNWHSVHSGKLCPTGWHVPSKDEWAILENYLIGNGYNFDGTITGNKIAKSLAEFGLWRYSSISGSPGAEDYPEYNNKSGFSAIPAGTRYADDLGSDFAALVDIGMRDWANWWSSTETIHPHYPNSGLPYYGWAFRLSENGTGSTMTFNVKRDGLSVRCVKD